MNETTTGMSWVWVLFVVIVLYLIFCRNGAGLFGGDCGGGYSCNRVSNCEVEKQGIIDSASTRYLIEQQGAETRAATQAGFEALSAQNSRIYEQGLQETIFDLKLENQQLKGNQFVKEQTDAIAKSLAECCCGFNRRIDAIECQMLKTPPFFPTGTTFQGYNPYNACCNGSY